MSHTLTLVLTESKMDNTNVSHTLTFVLTESKTDNTNVSHTLTLVFMHSSLGSQMLRLHQPHIYSSLYLSDYVHHGNSHHHVREFSNWVKSFSTKTEHTSV